MQKNEPISAAATQMAAGAVVVTVLIFVALEGHIISPLLPICWLLTGPAIYVLDLLFLRKSRTVTQFALLNSACGVALFVSSLLIIGRCGAYFVIIAAVGAIILAVQAANLVRKGQSLSRAIEWMDIALIVLVLFTAWLGGMGHSLLWSVPPALGCAAAVLGLTAFRSGGNQSAAGWAFLAGALAVLCGGSALLFRFAAEGAGRGLVSLWNQVRAFGVWLGARINQFMEWLVSLFPPPEEGTIELEEDQIASSTEAAAEESVNFTIPFFVWILLGIAVVILLLLVLRMFGRNRTGGKKITVQRETIARQRHPSLWRLLRHRLADLREGVRLRIFLARRRDTVLGAFYSLLRRARGRKWRRESEVTPREFLSALLPQAAGDPELTKALTDLIPAVERVMYASTGENVSYPAADVLRKGRRRLLKKSGA